MNLAVKIGVWHEESRQIQHCPTGYAADHETLLTYADNYPVRINFDSGYNFPMPHWLLVGLKVKRIEGRLYSGFGGVNYASTELKAGEELVHTLQIYEYYLQSLVETGRITLYPAFEDMTKYKCQIDWVKAHEHTWETLLDLFPAWTVNISPSRGGGQKIIHGETYEEACRWYQIRPEEVNSYCIRYKCPQGVTEKIFPKGTKLTLTNLQQVTVVGTCEYQGKDHGWFIEYQDCIGLYHSIKQYHNNGVGVLKEGWDE